VIFEILGEPVGEGRARAVRMGPTVRMHAAPKSAQWRALAASQMHSEWGSRPTLTEPVTVTLTAVMARPKSLPKKLGAARLYRATKPDVDNIAKAVFDALTQAGVIGDDAQIVMASLPRVTAAVGELPRTIVEVGEAGAYAAA
jgi:Holliday junction resolvase RusA-like endonuclease